MGEIAGGHALEPLQVWQYCHGQVLVGFLNEAGFVGRLQPGIQFPWSPHRHGPLRQSGCSLNERRELIVYCGLPSINDNEEATRTKHALSFSQRLVHIGSVTEAFNDIGEVKGSILEGEFLEVTLEVTQIVKLACPLRSKRDFAWNQIDTGESNSGIRRGEIAGIKAIAAGQFKDCLSGGRKPTGDGLRLAVVALTIEDPIRVECHMYGALL